MRRTLLVNTCTIIVVLQRGGGAVHPSSMIWLCCPLIHSSAVSKGSSLSKSTGYAPFHHHGVRDKACAIRATETEGNIFGRRLAVNLPTSNLACLPCLFPFRTPCREVFQSSSPPLCSRGAAIARRCIITGRRLFRIVIRALRGFQAHRVPLILLLGLFRHHLHSLSTCLLAPWLSLPKQWRLGLFQIYK
jgi:hypothetical protein